MPIGEPREVAIYLPLKMYTGLFRTFAFLEADSAASLVGFANTYGLLGGHVGRWVVLEERGRERVPMHMGERKIEWSRAINRMARLVRLWDALRIDDEAAVAPHIIWSDTAVSYESHPDLPAEAATPTGYSRVTIADERADLALFKRFPPGDVILPGWYYLQSAVNEQLKREATAPRLLWEDGQLGLFHAPTSLHAAMWLQFAQAIGGNKEFTRCVECSTWFELAPGIGRKGKRYCSDACRSAAYRNHKMQKSAPNTRRSNA